MSLASMRAEVVEKIRLLTTQRFNGDPHKLFQAYDRDNDGAITRTELTTLLADAGVGGHLTRWSLYAPAIISELDANDDGAVQWAEFEAVLVAPPAAG